VVTMSALHDDKSGRIEQARHSIVGNDAPAMMYLLIWTVFAEWPGMISLRITPEDIPKSAASTNTTYRNLARSRKREARVREQIAGCCC
jgi:hypothetical protein